MSTLETSRRGLWLAMAGLVCVPILAVAFVLSLTDDDRPKRRSTLDKLLSRDDPHALARSRANVDVARSHEVDDEHAEQAASLVAHDDPGARAFEPEPPTPASGDSLDTVDAGALDPESAEGRLAESRRLEKRDPKRARALLREILAEDPNNVAALERLSAKLLIDENHVEAKRLAQRCRGLTQNPVCDQVSSLAVENNADVEKIASAVKDCVAQTPGNVGCLSAMVHYHLVNGEVGDAAVYAGRLTQAAPQAAETVAARGRIKAAGGEYAEARQLLDWACQQGEQQSCFRLNALKDEGW